MTWTFPHVSLGGIVFLLTRPLRDVTMLVYIVQPLPFISTHTPLAGRDQQCRQPFLLDRKFLLTRPLRDVTHCSLLLAAQNLISTHTPLAGRDGLFCRFSGFPKIFLLTRPLRDVTIVSVLSLIALSFLLTRPLRDVTGGFFRVYSVFHNFYSHAPCGT